MVELFVNIGLALLVGGCVFVAVDYAGRRLLRGLSRLDSRRDVDPEQEEKP